MANREQPPEILASWSEAYDSEIRFMDEQLGELFAALPSLGIDDDRGLLEARLDVVAIEPRQKAP